MICLMINDGVGAYADAYDVYFVNQSKKKIQYLV